MYFSYHATARRLIDEGKLKGYYYTDNHNGIQPALVLVFDDFKHPLMPIREHKWNEYQPLLCGGGNEMQRIMTLEELTADYKSAIKNWNKERQEMERQIMQQSKIISILEKRTHEAETLLFESVLCDLKEQSINKTSRS